MTCLILFATEGYLRLFIFFEKNRLFKVFLLCQQGLVTTMVGGRVSLNDVVSETVVTLRDLLAFTGLFVLVSCIRLSYLSVSF